VNLAVCDLASDTQSPYMARLLNVEDTNVDQVSEKDPPSGDRNTRA
jgi:hypothetical protein